MIIQMNVTELKKILQEYYNNILYEKGHSPTIEGITCKDNSKIEIKIKEEDATEMEWNKWIWRS